MIIGKITHSWRDSFPLTYEADFLVRTRRRPWIQRQGWKTFSIQAFLFIGEMYTKSPESTGWDLTYVMRWRESDALESAVREEIAEKSCCRIGRLSISPSFGCFLLIPFCLSEVILWSFPLPVLPRVGTSTWRSQSRGFGMWLMMSLSFRQPQKKTWQFHHNQFKDAWRAWGFESYDFSFHRFVFVSISINF